MAIGEQVHVTISTTTIHAPMCLLLLEKPKFPCGELRGWRAISDFTKAVHDSDHYWSPDLDQRVDTKGRRKSHCIRNDMDALEASDKRPFCLACGGNHLRKNCDVYPTNRLPDGTEVLRIPKRNSRQATQHGPSA